MEDFDDLWPKKRYRKGYKQKRRKQIKIKKY